MEGSDKSNETNEFAQKWQLLRDHYRRSDGEVWKGTELERATGKVVSSAYLTAMKNGGIKDPGLKFLRAIARAMGFPFDYWLLDVAELRERLANNPVHLAKAAEEPETAEEGCEVAEAVALVDSLIMSNEVMLLYRKGGFSPSHRSLLRRLADTFG